MITAKRNSRFSKNLFWDADPNDLDLDRHKTYVVGRVLDYGEWNDWQTIRNYYGIDELKNIAMRIRTMFPKSLSFIATMTHTPENQFRCYEQVKKNTHQFMLQKNGLKTSVKSESTLIKITQIEDVKVDFVDYSSVVWLEKAVVSDNLHLAGLKDKMQ